MIFDLIPPYDSDYNESFKLKVYIKATSYLS